MNQILQLTRLAKIMCALSDKTLQPSNKNKVKMRKRAHLSLYLMKHHAMKMYRRLKTEL
jgi:hypothetical protein